MKATKLLGAIGVAAGLTIASIAVAGTASAGPPLNEKFHDEFTDVIDDFCGVEGLTVRTDVVIDGKDLIHSGQNVGFMEHVNGTSVDTNEANGNAVTETFHSVQRAKQATDNGDGTFTVLFLQTGNDVTYGPDGKAIARNPGQVRYELLIDGNGTPSDPSDDEVLAFLGFVKESTGRTDDFCAAVVPVLTD
jgi:hypothetical protein